jgi:hypothetical protein
VFSLNVPLPPAVDGIGNQLADSSASLGRIRTRHTLVCKRFADGDVPDPTELPGVAGASNSIDMPSPPREAALKRLCTTLRAHLASTDPFDLALTGVDAFETPASGAGPVVYLAVESPPLVRLHRRLCTAFGAADGVEGDAYVPHVTLARGTDPTAVRDALDTDLEATPVRWRADALTVYDAQFREAAATLTL